MHCQAKSINPCAALPSFEHKRKQNQERLGKGENESQLPSPCLPAPIPSASYKQAEQPCPPFQAYKQKWKMLKSQQVLPGGHSTHKKMCLWFGGTSGGLWSGYEHIIMAIHIPAPQFVNESTKSHCQAAKSPEALPKSNCLVENPFTLCHSTECAPSSLTALHKSIHTSAWIAQ